MTGPRVVSLLAAATEIVCALGQGDHLVGRSHECDHPPWVRDLPVCSEPRFRAEGLSGDVDRRVRELVERALSIYRVDPRRMEALAPTHVLTQTQCEVCAVSLEEVEAALAEVTGSAPRVVALEPTGLEDVWGDIRRVGAVLGAGEEAEGLVTRMQRRMAAVARRARDESERPTVAALEWTDPLMGAGNWMPELVERAGGTLLFGDAGEKSRVLAWEAVRAADPDVLLVVPCGYGLDRAREELPALAGWPGWRDLRAVRDGRVAVADGNAYFHRSGPRLVESVEILAEILHPPLDYGHRGRGWEPVEPAVGGRHA